MPERGIRMERVVMLWDFDLLVIRSTYDPLRPVVDLEPLGAGT
jgi:hypothetical protein